MPDSANNMPARLDLNLWRGDDQTVEVTMVNPTTRAVLSPQGYQWSAPIYESIDDALADTNPIRSFTVSFSGSKIVMTLLRTDMADLAMGPYVYGLRADFDGRRRTYLAGSLRLPA